MKIVRMALVASILIGSVSFAAGSASAAHHHHRVCVWHHHHRHCWWR
jgi:hypothetical protein